MVTCADFGSAHLAVRGSFFRSTRLNRVDSVKSGQHSELTRSTQPVNSVDPVNSVERLERERIGT
ncbi:hypothetical protein Hdeb2414_s0009g00311031 [Helianthus debilis subsp. tardiflorus]